MIRSIGSPVAMAAWALCICAGWARPAGAADGGESSFLEPPESLLHSYSAMVGLFREGGGGELSGWKYGNELRPQAFGFRYYERNGFVSGTIAAIAISLAGAAAANSPKSREETNYGSYKIVKTTYYSPAERAAMMAATSAAAAGIFGAQHQSFDLQVYSRNLAGQSEGYKANMLFGIPFESGKGMFDLGFGWGHVTSTVGDNGRYLISKYQYLGMPFRLSYAVGPVLAFAHFEWNWYGHSKDEKYNSKNSLQAGWSNGNSGTNDLSKTTANTALIATTGFPWRFGAQAALLGYLYLEGSVTTPSLLSGSFGYNASIGARF